jgi:hypothetical protein
MWYDKYFTNEFLKSCGRLEENEPNTEASNFGMVYSEHEIKYQALIARNWASICRHNKLVIERIQASQVSEHAEEQERQVAWFRLIKQVLQDLGHDIVSCMMVYNTSRECLTEEGLELKVKANLCVKNPLFAERAAMAWVHRTLEMSNDQVLEMYNVWHPFDDIELLSSEEEG